ncbi:MAG: hypothetical protein ACP5KB_02270 [Thermoprotei archaeon]
MVSKHNFDFLDILSKAIIVAKVYGVGSGRATGFGHITIRVATKKRRGGWGFPTQILLRRGKQLLYPSTTNNISETTKRN